MKQKRISGPLLDRHRHPVRGAAHPPQPSPSEPVDVVQGDRDYP